MALPPPRCLKQKNTTYVQVHSTFKRLMQITSFRAQTCHTPMETQGCSPWPNPRIGLAHVLAQHTPCPSPRLGPANALGLPWTLSGPPWIHLGTRCRAPNWSCRGSDSRGACSDSPGAVRSDSPCSVLTRRPVLTLGIVLTRDLSAPRHPDPGTRHTHPTAQHTLLTLRPALHPGSDSQVVYIRLAVFLGSDSLLP